MAWVLYDNFKLKQNNGNAIDLDTDSIKCMLVKSTYTPAAATHDFIDDVNAEEVAAGASYSAGGPALAGKTMTLAGGVATFDANDVTIAQNASGFTDARYAVLYQDSGVAGTSKLIAYADLGGNKSIQGGDLTLQMDAAGIITFS
jgi:hypothetical protein